MTIAKMQYIIANIKGGISMSWQEKVKNLMNDRGINQKQLSQLSGITESSVSRYLRSDRRPRLDVVVNFAKAFGVATDYLLDDGEESEASAYKTISTAIARKGGELTPEEKNELIALLLGSKADV
ncbi:xre family toxin-antitoxin system [Lactobacillus iners DSM 13335]|nr:xre family toxin-antitoxin system [Lactobacillus iners DSM 13335]